ncbi:MAG TPA: hypothetical protein VJ927_10165 [Actinomycetota bacterium]|nr:hypothetical protein [Actinomycetota bacterium]
MKRGLTAVVLLAALAAACTGPDPNVTETGAGKPRVTAEFPETAEVGEVHTATIEVTNPGPRDMSVIVVSFARVGDPSLPFPIVEPLPGRARSGIEAIRPEPNGESPPDATYTFDGLAEGESTTIEFDLRIPDATGTVGNVIQVYDGAEVGRAAGVRIETEIR